MQLGFNIVDADLTVKSAHDSLLLCQRACHAKCQRVLLCHRQHQRQRKIPTSFITHNSGHYRGGEEA